MMKSLVLAATLAAGVLGLGMTGPASAAAVSASTIHGAGADATGERAPLEMRRGDRGNHYGWTRGKPRGWYKHDRWNRHHHHHRRYRNWR